MIKALHQKVKNQRIEIEALKLRPQVQMSSSSSKPQVKAPTEEEDSDDPVSFSHGVNYLVVCLIII